MDALKKALGELIYQCKIVDVTTQGQFGDEIDKITDVAVDIIRDADSGITIITEVELSHIIYDVETYFTMNDGWTDDSRKIYNDLKNAVIEVIKAY